eukprot:1195290-Prorocentrum_minimum.AAC.2
MKAAQDKAGAMVARHAVTFVSVDLAGVTLWSLERATVAHLRSLERATVAHLRSLERATCLADGQPKAGREIQRTPSGDGGPRPFAQRYAGMHIPNTASPPAMGSHAGYIPPPLLQLVLTLVVGTDHKYMAELLVGSHAGYILHPLL